MVGEIGREDGGVGLHPLLVGRGEGVGDQDDFGFVEEVLPVGLWRCLRLGLGLLGFKWLLSYRKNFLDNKWNLFHLFLCPSTPLPLPAFSRKEPIDIISHHVPVLPPHPHQHPIEELLVCLRPIVLRKQFIYKV